MTKQKIMLTKTIPNESRIAKREYTVIEQLNDWRLKWRSGIFHGFILLDACQFQIASSHTSMSVVTWNTASRGHKIGGSSEPRREANLSMTSGPGGILFGACACKSNNLKAAGVLLGFVYSCLHVMTYPMFRQMSHAPCNVKRNPKLNIPR